MGFHTPLGYRLTWRIRIVAEWLASLYTFFWYVQFLGRKVIGFFLRKGSDGLRIDFLMDMFSTVPKWWICHVGQQICGALTVFQKAATLSGHLPSQNWRVQSSSVQQGPFMCLALLQPWHWVSPRCLSGPYGAIATCWGSRCFFFASRMSPAKGSISKGKDRLLSGMFFPMDISSFSWKYPFLVCFLEYIEYSPEV